MQALCKGSFNYPDMCSIFVSIHKHLQNSYKERYMYVPMDIDNKNNYTVYDNLPKLQTKIES